MVDLMWIIWLKSSTHAYVRSAHTWCAHFECKNVICVWFCQLNQIHHNTIWRARDTRHGTYTQSKVIWIYSKTTTTKYLYMKRIAESPIFSNSPPSRLCAIYDVGWSKLTVVWEIASSVHCIVAYSTHSFTYTRPFYDPHVNFFCAMRSLRLTYLKRRCGRVQLKIKKNSLPAPFNNYAIFFT